MSRIISKKDDALEYIRVNIPFKEAVLHGDAAGVIEWLDQGADPELNDEKGRSILRIAALNLQTEIVGVLLERGARREINDALFIVCAQKNEEAARTAEVLLTAGADPNYKRCLLQRANLSVINVLLAHGADPNMREEFGKTPLEGVAARHHYYSETEMAQMCSALIRAGASAALFPKAGRLLEQLGPEGCSVITAAKEREALETAVPKRKPRRERQAPGMSL